MSPARAWLLAAIRFYKRHVSPRKGFSCAYRVHVGACSCSTLGLRAVSRYGAWRGLGVLRLRLGQCGLAADELRRHRRAFVPRGQGGFIDCDIPCDASCADGCSLGDACEMSACLNFGDACDLGDCFNCGGSSGGDGTANAPQPRAPLRRRRRGEPVSGGVAPEPPPDASD